jgi:hypothetical protein
VARITRSDLYKETRQTCRALGLAPEAIWAQHSPAGWHVSWQALPHGAALPLGECLTAREALCLLQGLALAPSLQALAQGVA